MKKYLSLLLLFTLILIFPLSAMAEISEQNQEIDISAFEEAYANLPDNITDNNSYKYVKKAMILYTELKEVDYEIDTEKTAKMERLKRQYDQVKPHMVDLSSVFNRDIFANIDETVTSEWGHESYVYTSSGTKNTPYSKVGLDIATIKPLLNEDGILSADEVINFVQGDGSGTFDPTTNDGLRNSSFATTAEISAVVYETPFDLSGYNKDKNAFVMDNYANPTTTYTEIIEKDENGKSLFSGRPSDYLLILELCDNNTPRKDYTISFSDGTTYKIPKKDGSETDAVRVQHQWQNEHTEAKGEIAVDLGYKVEPTGADTDTIAYTPTHDRNKAHLYAVAFPTKGKTVTKIKRSGHSNYGEAPLLAITEIVSTETFGKKASGFEEIYETLPDTITDVASYKAVKDAMTLITDLKAIDWEISAEKADKIEKLEKQYNALKPYMVNLTSVFNRNVFANIGDVVNRQWGHNEFVHNSSGTRIDPYTRVGLDIAKIEPLLNKDGILSADKVINIVQGDGSTVNEAFASFEQVSAVIAETPFDLSGYNKGNNALAMDANVSTSTDETAVTITQNAEKTVFSGRPSKYLLILEICGRDTPRKDYTITFSDGESVKHTLRHQWQNAHTGSEIAADLGYRVYAEADGNTYTATASAATDRNKAYLVAIAVPTNGKIINKIERTGHSAYGESPLLALTEIPLTNPEFINSLALPAWDAVKSFTEADYTAENLPKIQSATQYYKEAVLRGLDVDTIFTYEDGQSGIGILESLDKLVLTATNFTDRAKIDEIKSIISFSVAAANIKENISVMKNGTKLECEIIPSSDGLSAEIIIPESKNGGNTYTFRVSKNIAVAENTSMTMGTDYEYTYTVPDYITYSYNDKTVSNSSDVPVTVTVASTITSKDGKKLYGAESEIISNLTKGNDAVTSVSLSADDTEAVISNYAFDNSFKLISNDTQISKTENATVKNADYKEPSLNLKTNVLTVNGFTPSKAEGKLVNLKIYDSTNSDDLYFGSIKTNKDGFFSFELTLPVDSYDSSFNMKFTVGGDDFDLPDTDINDVYYSLLSERKELIEYLKSVSDISDLTNGELNGESVTINKIIGALALDFEPVRVVSDNAFAEAIINVLKDYDTATLTNDLEAAQKALKQAAVIAAYNENKTASVYKDGEFLYEDIMNYNSIDTSCVTLYNVLKNSVSEEGRAVILKSVSGGGYKNIKELFDAIEEKVFYEALNYPTSIGTGYIESVLTAYNASAVNADISRYASAVDKEGFNSAIASNRGNFTDVNSVVSFIASCVIPTPPSGSASSGSTVSGVTSSMSASGFNTQDDSPNGAFAKPDITASESEIFNDVSKTHWAYSYIISLYNKGIVSGKGEKTFDPEGYVTRGEVAKMICAAYNLTNKGEVSFTDLDGKWYKDYVSICFENKIVNGISETAFGGDEKITRQDLCTILCRIKNTSSASEIYFNDKDEIAAYAKEAVSFMNEKEIVNGFSDNTFKPNDYCTRAQMAKIIDLFIGL